MAQHAALSPQNHRDLRIRTERSASFGDDVMAALIVPQEFRTLQNHYPIVFQRTPDREDFRALALLGFENGENLYLDDKGWDARILPTSIEVQPFLVGLPKGGEGETQVHIDLESPRIAEEIGARVFDDDGKATEFLERISGRLGALHTGFQNMKPFVAALETHKLLEPFTMDIELDDGSKNRLVGFHTINEETLRGLDAAAIADLHAKGFLMPIFMVVASLSNLTGLIARKNARHSNG